MAWMKKHYGSAFAAAALAIAVAAPMAIQRRYLLSVIITIIYGAYLAQCWNLMSGFTGQFSMGHAAFVGLGAYTSSLLYVYFHITPYIGMIVGMLVAGAWGKLVAFLSFRYKLKGDYFALSTLALTEILAVIFNNTKIFFASDGVTIPFINDWKMYQFQNKRIYYYIILFMLVAVTVFAYRLQKTKTGLYFIALRDSEDAADALGIDVYKYKSRAIVISAMFTALGGTFFAQYYGYIDSPTMFIATVSINCIAPCIIGGIGTIAGPILGAIVFQTFQEFTTAYFSHTPGANMLAYAVLLICCLLFFPQGLLGIFKKAVAFFVRKNKQVSSV